MPVPIITIGSPQAGDLLAETAAQLVLKNGSQLTVSIRDGRVILQPLLPLTIDQLYGIFAPNQGPGEEIDSTLELQRERRQDKW